MSVDPALRDLVSQPGPVATVYLGTPGDVVPASRHALLRWRALRVELVAQGVPEAVLAAIDPRVADAHLYGRGLCVVAGADGPRHVEHLPDPPLLDHVWWEPLPAVLPLLKRRQSEPPFVLVMADRRGADITAFGPPDGSGAGGHGDTEALLEEVDEVVDPDRDAPERKVAAGGWSQRRYQQRAENTWDARAKEVADHVARAAASVHAELVLLGGDVRAVQLLEEHLPGRWLARVEELPGGRTADGSDAVVAAATRRWVQTAAARRVVEVLEHFHEELGQHDRAVAGVADTRAALSQGRVANLLVQDAWLDDRRVPAPAGEEEGPRLLDVVVRDALVTGADVTVVPRHGGPPEGVGALLRWA